MANVWEIEDKKKSLEDYVAGVDYVQIEDKYIPSEEALQLLLFIKAVNGGLGEENLSPPFHLELLDTILNGKNERILIVSFRGSSKSTLMEYIILFAAVFGYIPNFGDVNFIIYVSDTIENGVKTMGSNLKNRVENSDFLKGMLIEEQSKLNQVEWVFTNKDGKELCVKGYGATTGIRGARRYNKRPQVAIFDDLLNDEDANSDTVIAKIEDTVYKALEFALHPDKNLVVWIGTPFNKKDPLYKAAGSGGWTVKTYPVCNKFPVVKEEFVGAWEDRFPYETILKTYMFLKHNGQVDAFNQELMLRIMSDDNRLVRESDIMWYTNRMDIINNASQYNWYITTDFATSVREKADYSVISVWAYSDKAQWFWVDGIVKRQLFTDNLEDLFRLVKIYQPMSTVIEVSGQQQGYISMIREKMNTTNTWFALARDKRTGEEGIRPLTDKLTRFNLVTPLFAQHRIWFPQCMQDDSRMVEALDEIRSVTVGGFKSAHDDFCDTISQLAVLRPVTGAGEIMAVEEAPVLYKSPFDDMYLNFDVEDEESENYFNSYIV